MYERMMAGRSRRRSLMDSASPVAGWNTLLCSASDGNDGDGGGADEAVKLRAKNEELLNELKAAKAKARELEQAEADRKAELAKREEEQLLKEGNYQKLLETEKQRASEKEGEALLYRAKYEEREIDLGLTSALTSAGVKPEFLRAASTML